MPKFEPTLVIGVAVNEQVDKKEPTMRWLLQNARFWLEEAFPQVLPIVHLSLATEEQLLDQTDNVDQPIGSDLVDGFRRCLEGVTEAGKLEKVEKAGIEVPDIAQLTVRIVLLVDAATSPERVQAVLSALETALRERYLAHLLVLMIAKGDHEGQLLPLREWLAKHRRLHLANLVVVDRFRSDGSNISREALPVVLQFLLLTALAPYEGNEHWLFRRLAGEGVTAQTVGVGLFYVPLSQIAEAASNYLSEQLSGLAFADAPAETQEWENQLRQIFHEPDFWVALFHGIEEVRKAEAKPEARPEEVFQVHMKEGLVQLDLSRVPWQEWADRIADYKDKWLWLLREFWLPRIRGNAQRKGAEAKERFEQVLDEVTRQGVGVFSAVEKLMEALGKHLKEWRCDKPDIPRGVSPETTGQALEALRNALLQVPNPLAIVARLVLAGAVIAYTTFALARWAWSSGFLLGLLRQFLPFVEPWMVTTVIAVLGVIVFLRTVWRGWTIYRDALEHVERCRDAAIQAIAAEVASILREAGLQVMEQLQKEFLGLVSKVAERNRQAKEALERFRQNWKAKAEAALGFGDTVLIRPCISQWDELKPLLDERLQGKKWDELWRNLLKRARVERFDVWCNWLEDGTVEGRFPEAAKRLWKEGLQGEEMKRLSFYLKPEERRQEVKEGLVSRYEQASRFLWAQIRRGSEMRWQLEAAGEPLLSDLQKEVTEERFGVGVEHQWLSLALPGIVGFLQVAQVRLPEPDRLGEGANA